MTVLEKMSMDIVVFFNVGEVKNTGALPVGTTELQFRVDDQCSGTTETLTIVVNNIVSLQLYLSQAKITKKKTSFTGNELCLSTFNCSLRTAKYS